MSFAFIASGLVFGRFGAQLPDALRSVQNLY